MATNPAYPHTGDASTATIRRRAYAAAHQELLAAIKAMEELTSGDPPDPLRFSHARLRVTRASMERRELFRRTVAQLSRNATSAVAHAISVLQEHDIQLLELTSDHIATWTADKIKSDWSGYCAATKIVRARSRENIERETRLLYPLLDDD